MINVNDTRQITLTTDVLISLKTYNFLGQKMRLYTDNTMLK